MPYVVADSTIRPGAAGLRTKLPFEASLDGSAVVYASDASVGGAGSTGLGLGDEFVARRATSGGWTQNDLQPPGIKGAYYQAFSSGLSVGVLQSSANVGGRISEVGVPGSLKEVPEVPPGYKFLYAHQATGSEGFYYPLFSSNPPNRSIGEFGTFNVPKNYVFANGVLAFAGGSASFGALLFEANGVLASGAAKGGLEENNLYVSIGGVPSLVNVLPGGGSEAGATFGAPPEGEPESNYPDFSHVISADGSRVFWTDLNTHVLYGSEGVGTPSMRTVELDQSEGPGASGGGRYWTASEDGSRVFFTDESQLTANSTAGEGAADLYEYDFDKPVGARLTDLTVDGNPGGHAAVQGVIGVSEEERPQEEHEGTFVYFVAQGVLAGNTNGQGVAAEEGQDNLYVLREGSSARFIARLTGTDGDKAEGGPLFRQNQ